MIDLESAQGGHVVHGEHFCPGLASHEEQAVKQHSYMVSALVIASRFLSSVLALASAADGL